MVHYFDELQHPQNHICSTEFLCPKVEQKELYFSGGCTGDVEDASFHYLLLLLAS